MFENIRIGEAWLDKLRAIAAQNQLWWEEPLAKLNVEDNEVIYEWWHQGKKITVYVLDDTVDYIKVWGADIDKEMEEGSVKDLEELTLLWQWIST